MTLSMAPPSPIWPTTSSRVTPPTSRGGSIGGEQSVPGMLGSISPSVSRGSSFAVEQIVPGAVGTLAAPVGSPSRSTRPRSLSPTTSFTPLTRVVLSTGSTVASDRTMVEAPPQDGGGRLSRSPSVSLSGSMLQPVGSTMSSSWTWAEASPLDGSAEPQEVQAWLNGQRVSLATLVQDTVTRHLPKMKESLSQEVHRCVQALMAKTNMCEELLQRLEAERSMRQSTLVGLRADFDRQQTQISELVQSRLTTSSVQDQALRERDEEVCVIVQNLRRDIDALRKQSRSAFNGNVNYSDQMLKVEKSLVELRKDLETAMSNCQQHVESVQANLDKSNQEQSPRKKAALKKEREHSSQIAQLLQQTSKQQEYQQQVERVVLELRKEIQGIKEQVEDQQRNANTADTAQVASDAAFADLRRQIDDIGKIKTFEERLQRFERDAEVANRNIQELARVVNTESVARVEMTQSLDAYRAAHLQTTSELRAELAALQENKGLRERTMDQMELTLQELMSVTELEREKGMAQSFEAYRQAQDDLSQRHDDMRKDIEAVTENCGAMRGFVDLYVEDIMRMVQEEREIRQQSSETSEQLKTQLDTAMEKISQLEGLTEHIDTKHGRSAELLERSLSGLRQVIADGEREEVASLRGGLETVTGILKQLGGEVEGERKCRMDDCANVQADMQAVKAHMSQLEASSSACKSAVDELRSIERCGLESVCQGLNTVATDVEKQKAARDRETSLLQTGMEDMRKSVQTGMEDMWKKLDLLERSTAEDRRWKTMQSGMEDVRKKLAVLESSASDDRNWRQRAVTDLEGILGDIRHIAPTVPSSRSLPTLATALRLNKVDD